MYVLLVFPSPRGNLTPGSRS